jgi:hypothetical protein
MLTQTSALIQSDLKEKSWNLIAQIEAGEEVDEALDLFLKRAAPLQVGKPTLFDLPQIHAQMRTEAGKLRPAGIDGATRQVTVDLTGRELKRDALADDAMSAPYSFYARLTGQPLVEVQLPGVLSTFMLARTLQYNGEAWRFDVFGGNRLMRGRQKTLRNILTEKDSLPSMLPAVRYADTIAGTPLMNLMEKLSPQREDWARMQRALMETVSTDRVAEGTLRLGWFDDIAGAQHPFKLTSPEGQRIALCPNDGCGFVKWEVAQQISALKERIQRWQVEIASEARDEPRDLTTGATPKLYPLQPQALMHFPRGDEVLKEADAVMRTRLRTLSCAAEGVDRLTLYRLTVGGGYQGVKLRAVPSADDKLYLPRIELTAFDPLTSAVLVGKAPYDQEYLLPISPHQVATAAQNDVTARFLAQCWAIQYSYTGFLDDRPKPIDDSQLACRMLHSKGMLIIVPPGYWPAEYADRDMVCSKEDLKIFSDWQRGRNRRDIPERMLSTGSLRVKDISPPGSLAALPIAELRKRNMDCDGDDIFVYAGYPALAKHIDHVMHERNQRRGVQVSLKPQKTANSAFDERGEYHLSRIREILAEQRGSQLLRQASTLVTRFLAQSDALREEMACSMMFGTYDGVEPSLRDGLRAWLPASGQTPQEAPAEEVLQAQAYAAIDRAHHPEARQMATLLHALVCQFFKVRAEPSLLTEALKQRFKPLAKAYERAKDTAGRIEAVLDGYPVCRLSHERFPQGQPGLVPGEPELTLRNLFTLALKAGTDAAKARTETDLLSKVIAHCVAVESHFRDRLREVPYAKQTAYQVRDGRFNPEQAKTVLAHIPNLAAGVMENALTLLQQSNLLRDPKGASSPPLREWHTMPQPAGTANLDPRSEPFAKLGVPAGDGGRGARAAVRPGRERVRPVRKHARSALSPW